MQMTNHSGQILPDALDHSHFCEDTQDTLDVEEESNPKFLELLMTIDDYTMTTNMKYFHLRIIMQFGYLLDPALLWKQILTLDG